MAKVEALPDDDQKTLDPRGVLTNRQFRAAQAKARQRIEDEKLKEAMSAAEQEAEDAIRREEGWNAGDAFKNELVEILIDLNVDADKLVIDGRAFWHGQVVKVPRHVADGLREIMFRGKQYEAFQIRGEKMREFYRRPQLKTINGKTGEAA